MGHTEYSVYIIGGFTGGSRTSTIAKYQNDIWAIAGKLRQARHGHGAITVNRRTMVIGGKQYSGTT